MYYCSIFLSRNPILQFQATSGGGRQNPQAVESFISYQVRRGGFHPLYFNWLYDIPLYGVGIFGQHWANETRTVAEIREVPDTFNGVPLIGRTKKVKMSRQIKGYEGHKGFQVRPANWFQDPTVTMADFQSGQYCGFDSEMNWNELIQGKHDGLYFNIDAAAKLWGTGSGGALDYDVGSMQLDLPEIENSDVVSTFKTRGAKRNFELHVTLIPKDWKLGESTLPEKWVFVVLGDQVIIGARPLGEYHNKYPFNLAEYEYGGHQFSKRSLYETTEELNYTLSWLFNSHMFNVRKALNNLFVINTNLLRTSDIRSPEDGLFIRTRTNIGANVPVSQGIQQLQVFDVTQNHIRDSAVVTDMMHRLTGANDALMGAVNSGGRKTAQEVRSSNNFSMTRLKTAAESS
jgi:hypothetical protein